MMKKVVGLLLVFLFIIPVNAFASGVNEVLPKVEVSQDIAALPNSATVKGDYVCVDDANATLTIQSVDGQIEPFTTCSGDGGYARIDSVFGSGGAVRWEVNPRFSTVHTFTGTLLVSKYVGGLPVPYDTIPITCTGALGGACGNTVNLGLPKGTYSVSMSGTARDASGLFSWIVPPCSIGISF